MELYAGSLTLNYEAGALRRIRIGGTELIRMISLAVRDTGWGTLTPVISGLQIDDGPDYFDLSFHCRYEQGPIRWMGHVQAGGRKDSSIFFDIHLTSRGDFQHNRAGIIVLHPIDSTAGRPCLITHADGTIEGLNFPDHISPWQPFRDIRAMEWAPAGNGSARLEFSGDVFEMEDHRNWSDHSFKTYGPPLHRPFPELMQHTGDMIRHSLQLQVSHQGLVTATPRPLCITLHDASLPMAPIGMTSPVYTTQEGTMTIEAIQKAGLSYYSLTLPLTGDWQQRLHTVTNICRQLNFPLDLRPVFSDDWDREWKALASILSPFRQLRSLCLLQQERPVPDPGLLQTVCHAAEKAFPHIPVGAGTEMHFAELNRWDIQYLPTSFISYPLHPQVHAFDNDTLVENLPAQQEMIHSARHRFPGKAIHVGPVSLKGSVYDPRCRTLFGAGWVLGSLKHLLEGGADSITYAAPYPLIINTLEKLLKEDPSYIRPTTCNQPQNLSSLLIGHEEGITVYLANHSPLPQSVRLLAHPDAAQLFDDRVITLEPYEITSITSTQSQPGPSVGA
jgi:hypothetical protein